MTPARVLIAEEESIAEELRDRLERMGLTVIAVVNSGEDAIVLAEETIPDLVLMDIRLKGKVDGIAAASTIRERLDIPTVYLTAHPDDTTIESAKKTFPLGYLLKPIAERELRTTLETALQYQGKKLRQEASKELQERVRVARATATAKGPGNLGFVQSPPPASRSPSAAEGKGISLALSSEAIQEQLHKILSSKTLVNSKRLVRFLSFVVGKGLKGEGGQLQ
jgi:DNA-binding NarL/FixJ family response regulator